MALRRHAAHHLQSYGLPRPAEQRLAGEYIPRHRHHVGYLTLVLSGTYQEDGDEGRLRLDEGCVVLHRSFEAHRNRIGARGCSLISFAAPDVMPTGALFRVGDPDMIVRTARRDPVESRALLLGDLRAVPAGTSDWPDLLAGWIRDDCRGHIGDWAREHRLARETISRGFHQAFGVTPSRYRSEARTRAALRLITQTREPLCDVAAECGFADQAHMTRCVQAMTGLAPGEWRRRSNPFKTGSDRIS